MKRKIIFLALLLVALMSVSVVSAQDNTTVDNDLLSDGNDDYNAEIVDINDYTAHYQSNDQLQFDLISYDDLYEDARFDMIDNQTGKVIGVAYYLEDEGWGYGFVDSGVGSYKVTLKLCDYIDTPYKIKPATINVKITKAPVKLTAKKWISTTKQYATLKVTVKDEYKAPVTEGTVKFTINGKTYTVKVKNGVATKKVKLTKAKTYTYKATFSAKNYKTKTVSSKVYVKKAKKYYTFKAGKYSCKMPYSKYIKLLDGKNNGKYKYFSFKIGKYQKKYNMYFKVEHLPKDALVSKGDYVYVWANVPIDMGKNLVFMKTNFYTLNP